jgi:hypothetical protein
MSSINKFKLQQANILGHSEFIDLLTRSGSENKETGPNKLIPLASQSKLTIVIEKPIENYQKV